MSNTSQTVTAIIIIVLIVLGIWWYTGNSNALSPAYQSTGDQSQQYPSGINTSNTTSTTTNPSGTTVSSTTTISY